VQFNTARQARNPVDHYLGMFKVLESLFRGSKSLQTMHTVPELRDLFRRHARNSDDRELTQAQVTELVLHLVDYRNRCAHLREKVDQGLVIFDRDTQEEVRPSAEFLETIAREALFERMGAEQALPEGLQLACRPVGISPFGDR